MMEKIIPVITVDSWINETQRKVQWMLWSKSSLVQNVGNYLGFIDSIFVVKEKMKHFPNYAMMGQRETDNLAWVKFLLLSTEDYISL